jgi:hypothetical protein
VYTILVDENHSLVITKKEKIMQRSQGVNSLLFLIKEEINGLNINDCTVLLEYWTPISKEYDSLILNQEGTYGDYLQFIVPFNLSFTKEHGNLQVQLSFIYVDLDENGNSIQKVKKTTVADIKITPIAAWSNMMPDSNFTAIDQRIIMTSAQIKALEALGESLVNNGACNIEDGVPVVDFTSLNTDGDNEQVPGVGPGDSSDDNVIEF